MYALLICKREEKINCVDESVSIIFLNVKLK